MSSPAQKQRLSAEQKKQNHIESERKRREAIRTGFEKLSEIVPDSKGKASSEGVVLGNALNHIKTLQAKKEELRKEAHSHGMSDLEFEEEYRTIRKKMRAEKDGNQPDSTPASGPSTAATPSAGTTGGGIDSSKAGKVRVFHLSFSSTWCCPFCYRQSTDI